MSTYTNWSTDQVIHWLKNDLGLNSIRRNLWEDLGINGNMLDDLLDDDGDELLKDELGITSKIHRKNILNSIKRLKEEANTSKQAKVQNQDTPQEPPDKVENLSNFSGKISENQVLDFRDGNLSSNEGSDTKQPVKEKGIFDQTIVESVYIDEEKKSEESEPKLRDLMNNFDAQSMFTSQGPIDHSFQFTPRKSDLNTGVQQSSILNQLEIIQPSKRSPQDKPFPGDSGKGSSESSLKDFKNSEKSQEEDLSNKSQEKRSLKESLKELDSQKSPDKLSFKKSQQKSSLDHSENFSSSVFSIDKQMSEQSQKVDKLDMLAPQMIDNILENQYAQRDHYVAQLEQQLIKENRIGQSIKDKIESIKQSISSSEQKYNEGLLSLKKDIQPIDISKLKEFLDLSKGCCQKIEDKFIFLILGCTGAGKSTFLQYISGVNLELQEIPLKEGGKLYHYGVGSYPEHFDPALQELITSPHSVSCTSYVTPIVAYYKNKGKEVQQDFVDTPGIEESRSLEQSIAGQKSIDDAAKACKFVVPVIVLNTKAFGDRMVAVKRIAKFISNMFTNFSRVPDNSIKFVFTGCKNDDESKESIRGLIFDFIDNLNDEEKADNNLVTFLEHLKVSVDDEDDMIVIDPLDVNSREKIITKLMKGASSKIKNPREIFQMQIGDATEKALIRQVQMNIDNHIRYMGILNKDYKVLDEKLKEILFLRDVIDMTFIKEKFSTACDLIKEEILKKFLACYTDFETLQGTIPNKNLDKVKDHKEIVRNLQRILKDTCQVENIIKTTEDFDLLIEKTADRLFEQLTSQDIVKSKDVIINLLNISNKFIDSVPHVEEVYLKASEWCMVEQQNIIQKIEENLVEYDYQQVADNFNELKTTLQIIVPFLGSQKDMDTIIEKQMRFIYQSVTDVSKKSKACCKLITANETTEQIQMNLKEAQEYHDILDRADKCVSLQRIFQESSFGEYRQTLEDKLKEIFDQNLEIIKNAIELEFTEDLKQISDIKKIKQNLALLKMTQEINTFLVNSCGKLYIAIVSEIYSKIDQSSRKIENIISEGYFMNRQFDSKTLLTSLALLEGLEWMDQFAQNESSTIKQAHEDLSQRVDTLLKHLQELANETFQKNCFDQLEKVMDRLQSINSKYKQAYDVTKKELKEKLSFQLKAIKSYQEDHEQTMKQISYGQSEEHLQFFDQFVYTSKHFGQRVKDVSQMNSDYTNFLTNYKAAVFIIFDKVNSTDDFTKIMRIHHEIYFMQTKSAVLLQKFFDMNAIEKSFQKSCQQVVNSFELLRQTLKQQDNQKELEKLKALLMSVQDLDKYFDGSKKIQGILIDIGQDIHEDLLADLKELIECLKQRDYENAQLILDNNLTGNIQERGAIQVKKYLKVQIDKTQSKKRSLGIFAQTNQLVEFYDELGKLMDAYQSFQVEKDSNSYNIGKEIMQKIADTIKDSKKAVRRFFEDQLLKIDKSIQSHTFNLTIKLINALKKEYNIVESLLDDKTKILVSIIDKKLEGHITKTIDEFKEMKIQDYLVKRPKHLVQKMMDAKDESYDMEQNVIVIEETIRKKYDDKFKELKERGLDLQHGLKNEEYMQIKRSLYVLPDNLEKEIQGYIDNFETEYQDMMDREMEQSSFSMKNGSTDVLIEQLKRLQVSKQYGSYQILIKDIMELMQTKFNSLKTATDAFENFALIADSFQQVVKFAKIGENNTSIKYAIDQSQQLLKGKIEQCLRSIKPKIIGHMTGNSLPNEEILAVNQELTFIKTILQTLKPDEFNLDINNVLSIMKELLEKNKHQYPNKILKDPSSLSLPDNAKFLKKYIKMQLEMKESFALIEEICKMYDKDAEIMNRDISKKLGKIIKDNLTVIKKPSFQAVLRYEKERTIFYEQKLNSFKILEYFDCYDIPVNEHLSPEDKVRPPEQFSTVIQQKFVDQAKTNTDQSVTELSKSSINETQLTQILKNASNLLGHLRIIAKVFKGKKTFESVDKNVEDIETAISTRINVLVQGYKTQTVNVKQLASTLIKMKMISDSVDSMKAFLDQIIDVFINEETKKQPSLTVHHLSQELGANKSIHAQSLLTEHSQFKAAEVFKKNALLHNEKYGIKFVMEEIEGRRFNKEKAKEGGGLLNILKKSVGIVSDVFESKTVDKDYLQKSYRSFSQHYGQLDKQENKYTGFLGQHLQPEVDYAKIREEAYGMLPQDLGKDLIWSKHLKDNIIPKLVAIIFGTWTVLTSQHYFESDQGELSKNFLLQPHPAQVISIFRMLGLGNFSSDQTLQNHLVQVKTGEGKSITIAVVAATLALLGQQVSCSCYSQHLSQRDYNSFKKMFEVLGINQSIHYGTLEQLCENIINQKGDVRKSVEKLLLEDKALESTFRPQAMVLIIDEVDTFFSKQFYGQIYQPVSLIKNTEIEALIFYIWKNRKNGLSLKKMQSTDEYKNICAKFKNQQNKIIDEAIKQMIFDVGDIDNHTNYIVKENKIGYVYGDRVMYNISQGYLTSFAYIQEYEKKTITKTSVSESIGLRIACGSFSYSEIPLKFDTILGISGTVETISNYQRSVIYQEYNFVYETYIPSVFGENRLKWSTTENLFVENRSDYFQTIRKQIDASMSGIHGGQRAVLVFFKDEIELKEFYNSPVIDDIMGKVNYLTEEATSTEVTAAVKKATHAGAITLLTRAFSRGTDFIILDEVVKSNGGTCTIQTFVSESASEEVQIKGRSARQGQDGSYLQILLEDDLFKYDITKEQIKEKRNHKKLYEFIQEKVEELFNDSYSDISKTIIYSKESHQKAEKFLDVLFQNASKSKEFLISQNQGPDENISKTLILIDGTYSMSSLLSKTKATIQIMFDRIAVILQDNGIDPSKVMMKVGFYRNYNSSKDMIYQESNWETKASNLKTFLGPIDVSGGWGPEAVEIGFYHAEKESELSQIILIGDAPANPLNEFNSKRDDQGADFWNQHFPGLHHHEHHLKNLVSRGIKVHSMYLTSYCENSFKSISNQSNGDAYSLDIASKSAAEKLTGVVSTLVLNNVGGKNGRALVEKYKSKFGGFT